VTRGDTLKVKTTPFLVVFVFGDFSHRQLDDVGISRCTITGSYLSACQNYVSVENLNMVDYVF
jgi:hypothetical protein